MIKITRRKAIKTLLPAVFVSYSGCSNQQNSAENGPSENTDSAGGFLPHETDGWRRVCKEDADLPRLGGEDGVYARYNSPNNNEYDVLVLKIKEQYPVGDKAKTWKCDVEWQVVLTYKDFIIAAGTGTAQKTFTPEEPPQMTRTPIPESTKMVKELLSNSPQFDSQDVNDLEVTDEDCQRG